MARIICFGDSITFGYTDPEGGWTQRLHNLLAKIYVTDQGNPLHQVINLGISGDTSKGVMGRISPELKPRAEQNSVVLIAIGVNDSIYRMDVDEVYSNPEDFSNRMKKIVKASQQSTDKVALVGLLPCEDSKVQPIPWSQEKRAYSNKRLTMFNDELRKVAQETKIHFFDMFEDMFKRDYEKYLFDGIHPNSAGHQYIADHLNKKVAEMANDYN